MTLHHARIGDRIVRYHDVGIGRPLLLLHAFPLSADQWIPQLPRVPPGWRLIAPDVRGFRADAGAAREQPLGIDDAPLTMAVHAADVIALMDHLRLNRAVVGGLSMGGYIALALARIAGGRLDGLVLADTKASADDEAGRAARDAMITLINEKGLGALSDALVPKLLGATAQRTRPDLVEHVRALVLQGEPAGIISAVQAMKVRDDSTPLLAEIACPVLILCGMEDVLTKPRESEAMAAAIPGAELVLFPGAGHLSNLEAPEAFTEALSTFLGRIPRQVSLTPAPRSTPDA